MSSRQNAFILISFVGIFLFFFEKQNTMQKIWKMNEWKMNRACVMPLHNIKVIYSD